MAETRMYHTATVLLSGKVLVTGGWSYNSHLATAEVYDPATGSWSPTGAMTTPRQAHSEARLPSGKVLVVGGENGSGYTPLAELYDPATGMWSPAGATSKLRGYATATAFSSGKVLVAGGLNLGGAQRTVDVYDAGTGSWSTAAPMLEHRRSHTATLLPSGKVLVVGGWGGTATATAELYDPTTGTWSPAGSMTTPRYDHTATLLPSGKVLVAGGQNGSGTTPTAELYDPGTGTWTSTAALSTPRAFHTATLVSGKVFVAGGRGATPLSTVEAYTPETGTWSPAASMLEARSIHGAVLLTPPNSVPRVLVVGGRGSATLASAEWLEVAPPVLTSCKQIRDQGLSTGNGIYSIDADGSGPLAPFRVYCDMTTAGGGWTVIEKSPYGNPIRRAFYSDVPVDEGSPALSRHRFSKARMTALKSISTDMRIDCRGNDYLLTAASNLFNGQGGPNSCANAAGVLYKEASLKGRVLTNKVMCTWFPGSSEGCVAWTIDEWYQNQYCGLPNFPWGGAAITSHSSDLFATDPYTADGTGHECHTAGAVRHTMLR